MVASAGMIDRDAAPVVPDRSSDGLGSVFLAARAGDDGAFGELYHRFARVVHGIALSQVGPGDAEDAAQEAFVAVHRGLAGVRDAKALPAWICTIARNTALDHLRRRVRRPARTGLPELAGPPERGSDTELRERVVARIRELPEAYRETLVLRLLEGLGGPEIAERTGLTPASVRVNLTRGMAMLRPKLEEEGWP